ncbi:MAG TPA: hypothetical protein PKD12_09460 [Nitrospira sp.]|mgnify:CR=1 FL=1|nr:hypothetical protein [Nitrospira sp.]
MQRLEQEKSPLGIGLDGVGPSLLGSHRGFLIGSILVFVAVLILLLLTGARGVPAWTEYLGLTVILAQVFLIHRREQVLYTSRRWRFWYALVIAGFACDLMTRHFWMQGHESVADPMQVRGQLFVGGLLLFYIMAFPVVLGLIIRNRKA